jgi:hypothetical protein
LPVDRILDEEGLPRPADRGHRPIRAIPDPTHAGAGVGECLGRRACGLDPPPSPGGVMGPRSLSMSRVVVSRRTPDPTFFASLKISLAGSGIPSGGSVPAPPAIGSGVFVSDQVVDRK